MLQRTLVIIKPDSVDRKIVGKILSEYEQRDLTILELKTIPAPRNKVIIHYEEHKESPHFDDIVATLADQKIKIILIEGKDAIQRVRNINGVTNPCDAGPNTIRGMYGSCYRYNCVHASDSVESAAKEISLWFE